MRTKEKESILSYIEGERGSGEWKKGRAREEQRHGPVLVLIERNCCSFIKGLFTTLFLDLPVLEHDPFHFLFIPFEELVLERRQGWSHCFLLAVRVALMFGFHGALKGGLMTHPITHLPIFNLMQ